MAVPDTTTFTLQNVVDEVNPTTDDLVDCFSDAVSSNFDPAYSGSKDNLLNFRNYNSGQYWLYNSATGTVAANMCGLPLNVNLYQYRPLLAAFNFNEPIYTDTSGTLASAGFWKVSVIYKYWNGTAWTGSDVLCP